MTAKLEICLNVHYPGFALGVDVALPGSGVTALFGPSGCGKTTLLRAVAGFERTRPSAKARADRAGKVVIKGLTWQDDANGVFMPTHLRKLGYVFQDASLFPHLNVAQNIDYGRRRVAEKSNATAVEPMLSLLGIYHLLARLPHTLSGGERQRVAIARALATHPQLLLMDEPLAALDAARKAEVLPYLEALQRELKIPVLYVTHSLDEVARLASHLVLLDAGRVLAAGAVPDLLTRLDLPLARTEGASAVITATVLGHLDRHHLSEVGLGGADGADRMVVPQLSLAPGHRLSLRIQARDVSLTLERQHGTSIQNILSVAVIALVRDTPGQAIVQLDVHGQRLLARVTALSAEQLGLAPGMTLFAQVKGAAILL